MVVAQKKHDNLYKVALTEKIEETERHFIITKGQTARTSLAEGHFLAYRYNDAIAVHGGKSTELKDTHIVSTARASIRFIILIAGKLKFGFDDINFEFDASEGPCAIAINLVKPVNFHRQLIKNNQVEKLIIAIHHDWIKSKLSEKCPLHHFIENHKANHPIRLTEDLLNIVSNITDSHSPKSIHDKLKLECLSQRLIASVLQQLSHVPKPEKTNEKHSQNAPKNYTKIEDIVSYIETHLDQDLNLEQLANTFSMSVSNLQRRFKQSLNLTVNNYIRHRRLEIAKQHLEHGLRTITEAAYEAGYRHPSNFTNAFKRTFGVPPHEIAQSG